MVRMHSNMSSSYFPAFCSFYILKQPCTPSQLCVLSGPYSLCLLFLVYFYYFFHHLIFKLWNHTVSLFILLSVVYCYSLLCSVNYAFSNCGCWYCVLCLDFAFFLIQIFELRKSGGRFGCSDEECFGFFRSVGFLGFTFRYWCSLGCCWSNLWVNCNLFLNIFVSIF